ncbi:hypothetical protein CLPUN_11630 [Clostridium puniceum]|uniref:Uncharacterized protein n=1 Tax=Clostridium puniceum TaxID=29367 RepID=A0A1S8TT77_9CLOT|nr:hypothetical protein [Clostridium puniceum]OOM81003.1 hypothetical protein CLPUN_11630 [Clostridium puniceum]
MSKIVKYVLIIIMIMLMAAQTFFINKANKEKDVSVYNVKSTITKYKSLKEINEELSCLKEKNILSANEINGKWYVKIKIEGDKQELLDEVSKIKNYEIRDYIITKNRGENSVVLEISAKESV